MTLILDPLNAFISGFLMAAVITLGVVILQAILGNGKDLDD